MASEQREELAAEIGRWTGEASLLVPATDISELLRWALLVLIRQMAAVVPLKAACMSLGRQTSFLCTAHAKHCLCLSSLHAQNGCHQSHNHFQACMLHIMAFLQAAGHEQRVCSSP